MSKSHTQHITHRAQRILHLIYCQNHTQSIMHIAHIARISQRAQRTLSKSQTQLIAHIAQRTLHLSKSKSNTQNIAHRVQRTLHFALSTMSKSQKNTLLWTDLQLNRVSEGSDTIQVSIVFVYLYLQCICISDTIEVKPSLPSQCWTVCHSLQNCCRGLNVHYLPPVDWSRSMTVATIFYILSLQYPPSNFFKSNFVPFQSQRNSIFFIKK